MKRLVINDLHVFSAKFDLPDGELLNNLYNNDSLSCNKSDFAKRQVSIGEHEDEFLTNGVRDVDGKKVISTVNSWERSYNTINPTDRDVFIRPVYDYGSIDKSLVKIIDDTDDSDIMFIEYGEYPQEAVVSEYGRYSITQIPGLTKTGNKYSANHYDKSSKCVFLKSLMNMLIVMAISIFFMIM